MFTARLRRRTHSPCPQGQDPAERRQAGPCGRVSCPPAGPGSQTLPSLDPPLLPGPFEPRSNHKARLSTRNSYLFFSSCLRARKGWGCAAQRPTGLPQAPPASALPAGPSSRAGLPGARGAGPALPASRHTGSSALGPAPWAWRALRGLPPWAGTLGATARGTGGACP